MMAMDDAAPNQLDKIKEAARQLGTDDDPERFKERVGRLVKQKLVPDREESDQNSTAELYPKTDSTSRE